MKKLNKISHVTVFGLVDKEGNLRGWMTENNLRLARYALGVKKGTGHRIAKLKITIEEWEGLRNC